MQTKREDGMKPFFRWSLVIAGRGLDMPTRFLPARTVRRPNAAGEVMPPLSQTCQPKFPSRLQWRLQVTVISPVRKHLVRDAVQPACGRVKGRDVGL